MIPDYVNLADCPALPNDRVSFDEYCKGIVLDLNKHGLSALYDSGYSLPAICCAIAGHGRNREVWRAVLRAIPRNQAMEAIGKFYSEFKVGEIDRDPKRRASLLYWRLDKLRSLCAKRRYKTNQPG